MKKIILSLFLLLSIPLHAAQVVSSFTAPLASTLGGTGTTNVNALTSSLNATNLKSGTVPMARLSTEVVTNNYHNYLQFSGALTPTVGTSITTKIGNDFNSSLISSWNVYRVAGVTYNSSITLTTHPLGGVTINAENYNDAGSIFLRADQQFGVISISAKGNTGGVIIDTTNLAIHSTETVSVNSSIDVISTANFQGNITIGGTNSSLIKYKSISTTGVGTSVIFTASGELLPLTSSARFKENIREATDNTSVIYSIVMKDYRYKKKYSSDQSEHYGPIAEQVASVDKLLVNYDKEGRPFSINNVRLMNYMLKEIQNLKDEIELLKKRRR